MPTEPKLKPCPFCGNRAELVRNAVGDYYAHCARPRNDVEEYGCGAQTSDAWAETKEQAARRWNERFVPATGIGLVNIINRRGFASVDLMRGYFEAAMRETKAFRKRGLAKKLQPLEENGLFKGYQNPLMDALWIGFAIGWRGKERYHIAVNKLYAKSARN